MQLFAKLTRCGALTGPIFTASSSAFSTEKEERKGLNIPMDSDKQGSSKDRQGNLPNLFSDFIREREMLYGVAPATIRFYRKWWTAFAKYNTPTTLETIKAAIVTMQESGLGVGRANNYIRAWQVFCNWLADRGHIERFHH